jgi:hypothetical protein
MVYQAALRLTRNDLQVLFSGENNLCIRCRRQDALLATVAEFEASLVLPRIWDDMSLKVTTCCTFSKAGFGAIVDIQRSSFLISLLLHNSGSKFC